MKEQVNKYVEKLRASLWAISNSLKADATKETIFQLTFETVRLAGELKDYVETKMEQEPQPKEEPCSRCQSLPCTC